MIRTLPAALLAALVLTLGCSEAPTRPGAAAEPTEEAEAAQKSGSRGAADATTSSTSDRDPGPATGGASAEGRPEPEPRPLAQAPRPAEVPSVAPQARRTADPGGAGNKSAEASAGLFAAAPRSVPREDAPAQPGRKATKRAPDGLLALAGTRAERFDEGGGAPVSTRARAGGAAALVGPTRQQGVPPAPPPFAQAPLDRDGDDARPADKGGHFVDAGTNPFVDAAEDRLSTFAIDVDTASYTFARRYLQQGRRPAPASVRVEEWMNAFHYEYEAPRSEHPFAIHLEGGPSPLDHDRRVVRVGIQGRQVSNEERKPVHLTFLVDVSGSMSQPDKLPLAQRALHLLVDQLRSDDSVGLITYAGRTEQVLSQTSADQKAVIHRAIDGLRSGGGTAMGSGMEMAYRNANKFLSSDSVSRIIVLSDGDANIGRTSHQAILSSVKGYVSEGITLSTVGFGTGNYQDHLMEQLADAGNGNYSYIDSMAAARKVFMQDLTGTLQVIAQDVKIQVEFNPAVVARYRLLGYENRDVADRDFRNDKVDAGEIGAGHSVTALYEVELHDRFGHLDSDLATVRVRYKQPRGVRATEVAQTFTGSNMRDRFGDLSRDTRWAAAVSVAAEVLRGSPYARDKTIADAWALASEAADGRYASERKELVDLLDHLVRRESVALR